MSKIITEETYTYIDKDDKERTEERETFRGLLVVSTLDRSIIEGYVHIFNDKDDAKSLKFKQPENKVNMDSLEFEQEFDVYSTEPIKALGILTHDIMQKLITTKQDIGLKYDISITQNMIIMRIFGKNDILDIRTKETTSPATYSKDLKNTIIEDVKFIDYMFNFMKDISDDIYSKNG